MKHRIEDLGRLAEKLQRFLDDYQSDEFWYRPKDACDVFFALDRDKQEDIIHKLAYQLDSMRNDVADCWVIAEGSDDERETQL